MGCHTDYKRILVTLIVRMRYSQSPDLNWQQQLANKVTTRDLFVLTTTDQFSEKCLYVQMILLKKNVFSEIEIEHI